MTISVLETVLAEALQPDGALHDNYMARNLYDLLKSRDFSVISHTPGSEIAGVG